MQSTPSRFGGSVLVATGSMVLSLLFLSGTAAAATTPGVVPVTAFTVASTQCDGPTYLPALTPALSAVDAQIAALTGATPGSGPYPPTFSSCRPLPSGLAPLAGSASVSSVASPTGSATVSAQVVGNEAVTESAQVDTTLSGSVTLTAPASSVVFSVPYTTSGLTQSGDEDPFALVSFSAATGLIPCVDGSDGVWSNPPGQDDLASPAGAGAGTAGVTVFCPDGSELAPGVVGVGVGLLANVVSDSGQPDTASAEISLHDVTATIDN